MITRIHAEMLNTDSFSCAEETIVLTEFLFFDGNL